MLRSLILGVAALATCVACGASSQDGSTSPSASAAPSSASSPSPSESTPSAPSELASYSPSERSAYTEATSAYSKYLATNARLLAAGRTTKAASNYYHRYAIDWVANWANLSQLANNKVTVTGTGVVKSTRPTKITLGDKATVVTLRQCVDRSAVVVRQAGKKVDQPELKEPRILVVRAEKRAKETWWRFGIARQGATC